VAAARAKPSQIKEGKAQATITLHPFCQITFDHNLSRIAGMFNETYNLPVLHYPQLLGLAMGFIPEKLVLKELGGDAAKVVNLK
jgi:heterodisulfide reductase subunit B